MLNFISYAKGYVSITVDGYFTERFINLCMNGNILLWDIKRLGETRISAKIMQSDFKYIRKAAKKTASKVRITEKKGVPFLLRRYRKRKVAAIGVILMFLMLFYFKTHVMGIDIKGNERLSESVIESSLKDFGVYVTAPLKGIDKRAVQNKMMTRLDDISWIGVNIKGSRIYIEIKERLDTKEGVNLNKPCDLIAKESGIIEELKVREGQSLVKRKEFVEKGDLLVSGAVDSQKGGIRYVHSYGEIYALTQRTVNKDYPLEYTEKTFTGKEKKKLSVEMLGKNLNLYLKEVPDYKVYEKNESKKEYGFLKNILPTVIVKTTVYKEQTENKIKKTEKEMFEKGKKEISEEIKKNLFEDTEIKKISAKYEKVGGKKINVTVNFELKENIAVERAIDKIENLNYDISDNEYNNK